MNLHGSSGTNVLVQSLKIIVQEMPKKLEEKNYGLLIHN